MSAKKVAYNDIYSCNILPTAEECEREYQVFIKEKALNQSDCFKENRMELFDIIYKMSKCTSMFAYCHTCSVIYDKSQYDSNHLDCNSGPQRAYFRYDDKKSSIDKDLVLIQMFQDLNCYDEISDTLFQYPICNIKKCGSDLKSQRQKEEASYKHLLNDRDRMFENRLAEQKTTSKFRKKTNHNYSETKEYIEYHKVIQKSRVDDINKLWNDVTKLVMNTMSLSVCEQDQIYIENTLCEMIHNFETIRCTKKILDDTKKQKKRLKAPENLLEKNLMSKD